MATDLDPYEHTYRTCRMLVDLADSPAEALRCVPPAEFIDRQILNARRKFRSLRKLKKLRQKLEAAK